ncbi:MAG: transporter substrate-binding domain-containing protein [Paucibacter sp.]|nr:transporter substrate-binding domain-containing protein [Roseateles sp.]
MRKSCLLWSAGLLVLSQSVAAASETECHSVVVSADPEFPPFAWYDGQTLRGASVDVVLTVLHSINLPYELRYSGPFLRLLHGAEVGEVDIITELKRTPDREAYLAFTETPIFSNPTSVFVRAGDSFKDYSGRESLRGLKGGVTRGTRFGGGLDDYVLGQLQVEVGPGIRENFSKLAAKRIDYFVSPHYPAMTYLVTSGLEDHFEVLKPFVAEAFAYVGWSRKSRCLERLKAFDAALKRYLVNVNTSRVLNSSFADWRRAPVMVR